MNTALLSFMLSAEAAAPNQTSVEAQQFSLISSIVMMVIVFGLMYLLMIRPQKKKEKEQQAMKDSLQIGDEVTTIGGITGIVIRINRNPQNSREDTVVIETGGERSKIRVKLWAISENATVHDAQEEIVKK